MNNKTNPTISIICPIYNVENYLCRCIDSVLNQSFVDFELLLIDDGSQDNSGLICDRYATKDSRIKVFHKQNGGVSSARNLGLDNARGEWIVFLDADDWVSSDFLTFDTKSDADIIQKSYIKVFESQQTATSVLVSDTKFKNRENFLKFYVQKRTNALWDKIFKRSLIACNRFNENVSIGEDFLFQLSLLKDIGTYHLSQVGCYYYVIRESSAMGKINEDKFKRAKIMLNNIEYIEEILDTNEDAQLKYGIIYQTYINVLYNYKEYLQETEIKLVQQYYKTLSLWKLRYVDSVVRIKLLVKKILVRLLWK